MKRSDITTKSVLEACLIFHSKNKTISGNVVEILINKTKAPEKVIYSALERDESNGYIEYGVSVRTAWVTDKGKQYLNSILK